MRVPHLALLAAATVALVAAAPARAQAAGPTGWVRVGGSLVNGDKDSSKLQQYQVIPDKKGFFEFDIDWDLGAGLYLATHADHLFWDDQHATFEFGRRAGFRFGLFYDRSPNWISNTASTYFTNIGGNVFVIEPTLHAQMPTATNLEPFAAFATPVDLRYVRRTTGGYLDVPFGDDITLRANYQDEHRSGTMPIAHGAGFSSVVELPVAIDYSTKNATFSAEYAKNPLAIAASAFVSQFSDGYDRVRWDNPNQYPTPTAGAPTVLQASTPPDNRAFNADLVASLNLPARHRITASFGMGTMRQDDRLLPYTVNTAIPESDPALLPITSANGKIDTTFYMVKISGDPIPLLGYSLSYRSYKVDNKSPEIDLTPVQGDSGASSPETTGPVGYKKNTARAEVHVNPLPWLRIGADYAYEKWDHEGRAADSNTEKTARGFVDLQFTHWAGLHASYADVKFTADCPEPDCAIEDEAPGATHFDIARRNTKRYNAVLTITPVEALAFGLSAQQDKNDFPDSVLGLVFDKTRTWGIDASYAMGDALSLYASYTKEKLDWDQASRYRPFPPTDNPLNDWSATTRDDNTTWTVGGSWQPIKDALTISLDVTKSDGTSDQNCIPVIGTDPAAENSQGNCVFPAPAAGTFGTPQDWPRVSTKFTWIKLRGYYAFTKQIAGGVEFWNYKFEGSDWATDVMNVYMGNVDPGASRFVFLGARIPDYDARIFRAYVDYRF